MTLGDAGSKAYLIGGWAIYYVLDLPDRPVSQLAYAGTLDVDVALVISTPELKELIDRLISKGYVRDKRIENRLLRLFPGDENKPIAVDFLTGDKEILPDFVHPVRVAGETPEYIPFDGVIAVANMEACLAMKAIAFDRDPKHKDAYDIYYLVAHARDENGDCADHVKTVLDHPLIQRGLEALDIHFGRIEGRGLRRAMQMLRDLDWMDVREARAAVRASLRAFFQKLGRTVDY